MSEHPGLEFAPPIVAFPNFTLGAPSSVIYNHYDIACMYSSLLLPQCLIRPE